MNVRGDFYDRLDCNDLYLSMSLHFGILVMYLISNVDTKSSGDNGVCLIGLHIMLICITYIYLL